MARVYTANISNKTFTNAQPKDIFEINANTNSSVHLLSFRLWQTGTADYGDAQAEGLPITFSRSTGASGATNGSGGGLVTARPHDNSEQKFSNAGGSVETLNNTRATALTTVYVDGWNVQQGFYYAPIPEERFIIPKAGRFVISLPSAPSDSLAGIYASVTIMEGL